MSLRKHLASLARDERGQTTTEYILILAVVVMLALKFKNTFGTKLDGMLNGLDSKLSEFNN